MRKRIASFFLMMAVAAMPLSALADTYWNAKLGEWVEWEDDEPTDDEDGEGDAYAESLSDSETEKLYPSQGYLFLKAGRILYRDRYRQEQLGWPTEDTYVWAKRSGVIKRGAYYELSFDSNSTAEDKKPQKAYVLLAHPTIMQGDEARAYAAGVASVRTVDGAVIPRIKFHYGYAEITSPTDEFPVIPSYGEGVITSGQVNLRMGPGRMYDRVKFLENGEHVTILGTIVNGVGDRWFKIVTGDGKQGFVMQSVISRIDPNAPQPQEQDVVAVEQPGAPEMEGEQNETTGVEGQNENETEFGADDHEEEIPEDGGENPDEAEEPVEETEAEPLTTALWLDTWFARQNDTVTFHVPVKGGKAPYTLTLTAQEKKQDEPETVVSETLEAQPEEAVAVRLAPEGFGRYDIALTVTDAEGEHAEAEGELLVASRQTESEASWAKSASVKLTGDASADLVAVARTQVDYEESRENFVLAEDGTLDGYTRYGAFYGTPYSEWCALFVAFSMHYAEHPYAEEFRLANVGAMREKARGYGIYADRDDYKPEAGDLVFVTVDGNPVGHMGVVTRVSAGVVETIQGNVRDGVRERSYDLDSASISGYASLNALLRGETLTVESKEPETETEPEEEAPETVRILEAEGDEGLTAELAEDGALLRWIGEAGQGYTLQQVTGETYRILTLTAAGEALIEDVPEEGATYRVRACEVDEYGVIHYLEEGRAITLRIDEQVVEPEDEPQAEAPAAPAAEEAPETTDETPAEEA